MDWRGKDVKEAGGGGDEGKQGRERRGEREKGKEWRERKGRGLFITLVVCPTKFCALVLPVSFKEVRLLLLFILFFFDPCIIQM